jgi:Zn-dependent protease
MLSWPSETPYDLRFRVLDIPVRVHVMFWVLAAVLSGIGQANVEYVAISVACIFVSILVHELGHGLTARAFGSPASIVLYWMGGLCRSEVDPRSHPWKRLAVVFMGPGAGLVLAGVTYLLVTRVISVDWLVTHPQVLTALKILFQINLYWSLLNLLPIFPLDGGQILGVVLGMLMPRQGRHWTHVVGLVSSGVLAFCAYQYLGSLYLTILLAMMAMTNFQILQAMHQQGAMSGYDESDEDWYRR